MGFDHGTVGDALRLTGGPCPDVCRCESGTCGRPFHSQCLSEWLAAVPTTRRSFGMLFGTCPYCSHPITCPSKGGV